MDINDYKHPAARNLDGMILRGATPTEIASVVANLRLVDLKPVCNDCMFIDRLFQPEFVQECYSVDRLEPFTGIIPYMPKVVLRELCRHRTWGKGSFDEAVFHFSSPNEGLQEQVSRTLKRYDETIESRMFYKRTTDFDWAFDYKCRTHVNVKRLLKSRWLFRLVQLDVFRSVSESGAWIILNALHFVSEDLRNRLARQAFLGLSSTVDERVDSLRAALWRNQCERYLQGCVRKVVKDSRDFGCRIGNLCVESDGFRNFDLRPTSKVLFRFVSCDSLEEMKMGETITGERVRAGNLYRFVKNRCVKLCIHYLPLLREDIDDGLLCGIVYLVLCTWKSLEADAFLRAIEGSFPGCVRRMVDSIGRNLLLYSHERQNDGAEDMSKTLIDLGCDPDERCLAGYAWNDIRRWEGAKQ